MKNYKDLFFCLLIVSIFYIGGASADCIIGTDLMEEITKIFTNICWFGLALTLGLGMLDFIKSVTGGKDGDLKTNATRFAKRLIACVILLILPEIVKWIFNLAGLSSGCSI